MEVRFYIDPASETAHCLSHGVTEEEVWHVLLRPGEDRTAKDGARSAIGRTNSGRHIRVIHVPDESDGSMFVITAHELTGKPLHTYRRRQRGRNT